METWHVYLLECADGTLYCGVTNNLPRRLEQHNGQLPGGAKYTRSRRPVRLAICALAENRGHAQHLENLVRRQPRSRKIEFLRSVAAKDPLPGSPAQSLQAHIADLFQ